MEVMILYLKQLQINNFRGIKDLKLSFTKGLNILIGENNSGKSSIIDVLRICFGYGSLNRDLFVRRSDFYIDKLNPDQNTPQIEFHLTFSEERPEEIGIFIDLLVQKGAIQELQLHFIYWLDNKGGFERIRWNVWGGEHNGQQVTSEVLNMFYHIYLAPLRDAERFLRPGRNNRLGELFSTLSRDSAGNILDDNRRQEMAEKLSETLDKQSAWKDLVESGKEKITKHLEHTIIPGKEPNIDISFLPFEFRKIVDNLRIQFQVYENSVLGGDTSKQRYLEIFQNGLGYNNLIYTATVLGDLKNRRENDSDVYIALLIEEPEAHLHPQLQNVFFKYLGELQTDFQIFITSHSPTLAAKAQLNDTIVLYNQNDQINCLSLSESDLDSYNKKYLAKFLDVTRSQLFFANGAILVEGISEALLLPVFAKMIGESEEEYDLTRHGVEVVNVNGVAFEHFARLFNSEDSNKRLDVPCVILTDDDRDKETDEVSSRAKNAKNLEKGLVKVELAVQTLEYELLIAGDKNQELMIEIFRKMHPKAAKKLDQGASPQEFAENFIERIKANKAKSELAHRLAIRLETDEKTRKMFKVPQYISNAIRWAVSRKIGEKDV